MHGATIRFIGIFILLRHMTLQIPEQVRVSLYYMHIETAQTADFQVY